MTGSVSRRAPRASARWLVGAGLIIVAVAGHAVRDRAAVIAQSPADRRVPRLFKDSRQALAIARAQGQSEIVLIVAAAHGRTRDAAADAVRLGGVVRYQDDEIGYLRVRVPLDAATAFSESPHVEAISVDWDPSQPVRLFSGDSATASGPTPALPRDSQSRGRYPPRSADAPLSQPYSPLQAIDATALLAANPTYDGRGVTIALFDGTPDLLVPELQTAYMVDGTRIPKIAGVLNVTDPRDDASHVPQWVNMTDEITVTNALAAAWRGQTYKTPHTGRFRIGQFDERKFRRISGAMFGSLDVDFSGNGAGDDGLFGVLWDETNGDVWVDTNRNLSFQDEVRLGDYATRQRTGVFGHDDPATAVRESIAFAVQTDPVNRFVSINVGIDEHATGILGAVVGNREPEGRLAGIAPGARIVSMHYGSSMHAAIEGLMRAFRDPGIDLIVFESHSGMMTHSYLLSDGRHPFNILVERLTQRYQKLMFVPGSNRAGFGLVAGDGVAPGVISVGAYQSKEAYLVNWGVALAEDDHLHFSGLSHGPPGNGALKPDLLAPSGLISTQVGFAPGETRQGVYRLPPGYHVAGGTSTATPMAAGAAAIVVSAARQSGVAWDSARLHSALTSTARFIGRLGAHEQGAGLIQVGAAWARLRKGQDIAPIRITTRAPVRTALSRLMTPPHEGVGLYEREGWAPGQRGDRIVTFTRTSGPAPPMTFAVRWIGNDGTFSSDSTVMLPLHRPVALVVGVDVKTPGAHSATLVLEHPSLLDPAARVLCTIVAALPLDTQNGFSVSTRVSVPRASDRSVFVYVPPATAVLAFSAAPAANLVRMTLVSPSRQHLLPCQGPTPVSRSAANAPRCAISRPAPGVWEINLWDGDLTYDEPVAGAAEPRDITLTISALAVEIDAAGATSLDVSFRNRGAALDAAAAAAGALGTAYRARRRIAAGEQHVYRITVPEGAALLRAAVRGGPSENDLDLYLLDCRGRLQSPELRGPANVLRSRADAEPPCTPIAKSADVGGDGEVEVPDPGAGEWAVVVDAFALSKGSVTYDYFDAFTHPAFGQLAVADSVQRRDVGVSWTAPAHAWIARGAETPREPYGRLAVSANGVAQAITDWTGQRLWPLPVGSMDLFFHMPLLSK